jgi:uncharacterized membrane protein YwzB
MKKDDVTQLMLLLAIISLCVAFFSLGLQLGNLR